MMNDSVGSAIEKIKLQEQDTEAKLKEKRDLESAISILKRSIRDNNLQIEKSTTNQKEIISAIDKLNVQLNLEKIRHDAFSEQLIAMNNEFKILMNECDRGIADVWALRSSLCQTVNNISEKCDIWALLVKSTCPEIMPIAVKVENNEAQFKNESRLQLANEKRERLIAERDRLRSEPSNGEEFVRTHTQCNRLIRKFSTKTEINPENAPIKFSTSPAARKAVKPVIRKDTKDAMPWYQPFSIVGSLAVFLIYFCYFREENDLDQEFNKTLYERIKGLEKHQLLQTYKYNKENGLSVEDIEKRLKEIEVEEAKLIA